MSIFLYLHMQIGVTILLICSGVGGFAGSWSAERMARGGVEGLSAMIALCGLRRPSKNE